MGAWDHTPFGNDDACDWAGDLRSYEGLAFIAETLERVVKMGEDYLEAPESCEAIAAAEAVARLQGRLGLCNSYTESVDEWVDAHPIPVTPELAQKAQLALDRVLTRPSELLDLWEESEGFNAWKDTIAELRARIQV